MDQYLFVDFSDLAEQWNDLGKDAVNIGGMPPNPNMESLLADYILVWAISTDAFYEDDDTLNDALFESLSNDPLFNSLDAVRSGNVIFGGVYWGEAGIYSAHAVLDDMFRYVARVNPEAVAPNPLR
ncbi:MAG: hypothetical protein AAF633_03190 [Chloroflexota bacterium]